MCQRIATLDSLRGLAILGILLSNISAFGLAKAAYLNPAYLGQPSVSDVWVWAIVDILAQGKFLSMFAMFFGAGIELLLKRGKVWIQTRLLLLLLLGLIHGIFFWDGDILLAYSLIGLVCWRIIRDTKDSASLLKTGIMLFLIGIGILLLLGYVTSDEPGRFWLPGAADLQYEQFWKLQGGSEAWKNRVDLLAANLIAIGAQYGWELAGFMLFGAGLMRSGWLRGRFTLYHYRRLAIGLLAISLIIQLPGVVLQWRYQWDYRWAGFLLQVPRELGAPLQTLGYLALYYGFWPVLSRWRISGWLAKIGRMALSNYLLQTLICTLFFYYFGFYQQFDRLQLLAWVPFVWLGNFLFSLFWLSYLSQGPVEWIWRKLTNYISVHQV